MVPFRLNMAEYHRDLSGALVQRSGVLHPAETAVQDREGAERGRLACETPELHFDGERSAVGVLSLVWLLCGGVHVASLVPDGCKGAGFAQPREVFARLGIYIWVQPR